MKIICHSCGNDKAFVLPLWVRCTFRFEEHGEVSILHVKQLESLEEKLTNQGKNSFSLTCRECGAEAEIIFDEYARMDAQERERKALEGL